MEHSVWKFVSTAEDGVSPSLHDCYVTRMELVGRELCLFIPDGFKLMPDDPLNPYDAPHMTGPSQVIYSLSYDPEDAVTLERFHNIYLHPIRLFHSAQLCTTVSRPPLRKLMEQINRGTWRLEFVSKFTHYDVGYLYECYIHTEKKTYRCYFTLDCRQTRFCWNEVEAEPAW